MALYSPVLVIARGFGLDLDLIWLKVSQSGSLLLPVILTSSVVPRTACWTADNDSGRGIRGSL